MKYTIPTLETDRLILKRGTLEDYLKVYEYDFTRLRDIGGEFEYVKCDPKKIEPFITYADEEENVLDFILYEKNGEPFGNIVADRYGEHGKSLEISINIHPNYWGLGYAKEAILEIMKYIFANLDIDYVIYGYAEENNKSKRVNDKIGFEPIDKRVEHYTRIDNDVTTIVTSMSKEKFYELYGEKVK
jgi:RimJ/RimL family protein N-acetyltransferase